MYTKSEYQWHTAEKKLVIYMWIIIAQYVYNTQ